MALFSGGSALAAAGVMGGSNLVGNLVNGANSEGFGDTSSDSSYGYSGESWNSSESYSDSWDNIYGTEASLKDIERTKEANTLQEAFLLDQMEYNAKEAAKTRAWQEYMSNTSYQRAVIDLYKAGLNPILAAGNYGASTPMGAVASSGLQQAYKAQTFADRDAGSHSESHSSGGSNESGGGSSHSEGHNESKSEQQATSLAKGAAEVVGKGINSLSKAIADAYNANPPNRYAQGRDGYDMPTI